MTAHSDARNIPARPPRRFSEGIERTPPTPSSARVGRFSDGIERSPRGAASQRIGGFADGLGDDPKAPSTRRVGSFSDGLERVGGDRGDVRRIASPRRPADRRVAA
jgi:hypothetical protein